MAGSSDIAFWLSGRQSFPVELREAEPAVGYTEGYAAKTGSRTGAVTSIVFTLRPWAPASVSMSAAPIRRAASMTMCAQATASAVASWWAKPVKPAAAAADGSRYDGRS